MKLTLIVLAIWLANAGLNLAICAIAAFAANVHDAALHGEMAVLCLLIGGLFAERRGLVAL